MYYMYIIKIVTAAVSCQSFLPHAGGLRPKQHWREAEEISFVWSKHHYKSNNRINESKQQFTHLPCRQLTSSMNVVWLQPYVFCPCSSVSFFKPDLHKTTSNYCPPVAKTFIVFQCCTAVRLPPSQTWDLFLIQSYCHCSEECTWTVC